MLPYLPPIDVVPTVLLGYVQGPLRMENRRGDVIVLGSGPRLFIGKKPVEGYAVTHLQKYSRFGFLLHWPFGFHVWFTFRKQKGNDSDGWVPGSEIVFYARTPGYRMDTDYGMKGTNGYIGLHWD